MNKTSKLASKAEERTEARVADWLTGVVNCRNSKKKKEQLRGTLSLIHSLAPFPHSLTYPLLHLLHQRWRWRTDKNISNKKSDGYYAREKEKERETETENERE
jgi:hypothetical protein